MSDKQKDSSLTKEGQRKVLACQLEPAELARRKGSELKEMRKLMINQEKYPEGYAFQFPGDEPVLDMLVRVIKQERKCCPFLTFELKVEKDDRPIWLHISGPDGTAAFLKAELNLGS